MNEGNSTVNRPKIYCGKNLVVSAGFPRRYYFAPTRRRLPPKQELGNPDGPELSARAPPKDI